MQDIETGSLWSQVSGKAIQGKLENKELILFPSTQTTFAEFKKLYPDGKLLKKNTKGFPNSYYESYFRDRTKLGVLGRVDNFSRLKGKEMIIGVRDSYSQTAVTKKYLKRKKICHIKKLEVLVSLDKESNSISVFDVSLYGEKAKFKYNNNMILLEKSDLSWDSKTGKLLSGDSKNLEIKPFTTAYWFAWTSFFPDSKLIK